MPFKVKHMNYCCDPTQPVIEFSKENFATLLCSRVAEIFTQVAGPHSLQIICHLICRLSENVSPGCWRRILNLRNPSLLQPLLLTPLQTGESMVRHPPCICICICICVVFVLYFFICFCICFCICCRPN